MIRVLGQAAAYAAFVVVIGVFSVWPDFRLLGEQEAIVSLTFSHATKRVEECRRRTREELEALPPNMRRPDECPRERRPIEVELRFDNRIVYSDTLLPSGIWKDGKANVYRRTTVAAGEYEIFIGMNDSGSDQSYDYALRREVRIVPGQNLVITFDDLGRTFVIE